ncbi:MAG: carboxypeptidase-like regulatory domain-containing protein [Ignavibacteria bacterium]|nr:carboxypeptidase-like regulatory domain-containing protein [Ignavibacteria bacterium]
MARQLAIILGVLAFAGFLCTLSAQGTTVNVEGKVIDNEGKTMPGANVVVLNEQTGQRRGAATNVNGAYKILGIPPGTYTIEVTYIGFKPVRKENVTFLMGQHPNLDITMTPEAVEVSGVEVVARAINSLSLRD